MDEMNSLQNLASILVATEVCLRPDVLQTMIQLCPICPCCVRKISTEVYDSLLKPAVLSLNIPSHLQMEVLAHTVPVALRLMHLVIYHENTFRLERTSIIRCLDRSLVSSQGLGHLNLGRKLLEDEELSVIIKYRLSCFYFLDGALVDGKPCIGNFICSSVWHTLPQETRDSMRTDEGVGLLREISLYFHSSDSIHEIFPQETLVKIFKAAVGSGSVLAVKYCWENLNPSHKSGLLVTSGLLLLSLIRKNDNTCLLRVFQFGDLLATNDCYLEILWILVSQMDENETEDFVRNDVAEYGRAMTLVYVLRWPRRNRFMEVAESMRKYLPQRDLLFLILEVLGQLEPKNMILRNSVHGNTCAQEYRIIFRELWLRSDSECRRNFFENFRVECLTAIIRLENLTYDDEENFRMILEDATADEKLKVFKECGLLVCYTATLRRRVHLALHFVSTCCPDRPTLIGFTQSMFASPTIVATHRNLVRQMEFADHLLKECFDTQEEISLFKMALPRDPQQDLFFELIRRDWQAFVNFMEWCLDTEEKLSAFKTQFLIDFSESCNKLALISNWREVDLFLNWIFSTEREIEVYKRWVLLPAFALDTVSALVESGKFQVGDTYMHWLGLSDSEIRELKHTCILTQDGVASALAVLIFDSSEEDPFWDPLWECVDSCIGRLEAAETIISWLLTDVHVTRQFQRQFHEDYLDFITQENVDTTAGLQTFDYIIERHLQNGCKFK